MINLKPGKPVQYEFKYYKSWSERIWLGGLFVLLSMPFNFLFAWGHSNNNPLFVNMIPLFPSLFIFLFPVRMAFQGKMGRVVKK